MRGPERGRRRALLCRWALLTSLAALAAWACVAAAVSIEREPPVVLSVSDGLYGPGAIPSVGVIALWESVTGPAELAQALTTDPRGHTRLMLPYGSRGCWVSLPLADAAGRTFDVEGIPYGPLAFARAAGRIALVSADAPVYLVDAPLLHEASPSDAAELLGELRGRGQTAFCDPGELAPFRRLREQLLRLAPGVLAIHAPPLDARQIADRFLARPDGRNVFIVTARASLAEAAASQGFVAYLVDSTATETGAPRLLTYPSVSALTRHLRDDRLLLESLRGPASRPGPQPPSDPAGVP